MCTTHCLLQCGSHTYHNARDLIKNTNPFLDLFAFHTCSKHVYLDKANLH